MTQVKSVQRALRGLAVLCLLWQWTPAFAARAGDMEVGFMIPYAQDKTVKFEKDASIDLNDDPGFGFDFSYYYSPQIAVNWNVTMNTVRYDAVRVLDDGLDSREQFTGDLDSFTMRFALDYYFFPGAFSPFVDASLGWNFVDSNIISGTPGTVCWWDPWWGYICDTYVPTYTENNFSYGLGAGLRADIFRNSFIKVGYFVDFIDFDKAQDTEDFGSLRFALGFKF